MKLNFIYNLKAYNCEHKQDSIMHLQKEVLCKTNAFHEINENC